MKVDPHIHDGSQDAALREDSVMDMLKRLQSLGLGADSSASPSWQEVRSMMEDLRPSLAKQFGEVESAGRLSSGRKSNVVDPSSIKAAASPKGNKYVNKQASPMGTLDEVDAHTEGARHLGKENAKPALSFSKSLPNGRHKDATAMMNARKSTSRLISTTISAQQGVETVASPTSDKTSGKKSFLANRFSKKRENAPPNGAASATPPTAPSSVINSFETGGSLFDADFLASFEKAMKNLNHEDLHQVHSHDRDGASGGDSSHAESHQSSGPKAGDIGGGINSQLASVASMRKVTVKANPLDKFEKLCPPGGEEAVVLYTTSLRGIRKTFDDCNSVRGLLQSFRLDVDERDISMHMGFRNELRELMGGKPVPVPRLFVKGRYIGGAEDVLQLHEEEKLAELLEGLPKSQSLGRICDGCGGARFVPCLECSGSRKVVNADQEVVRCPDCNENGLIQCPICC